MIHGTEQSTPEITIACKPIIPANRQPGKADEHRNPHTAPECIPMRTGPQKCPLPALVSRPKLPFVPDEFQLRALEAINRADCMVIAPTGSGKTWIAEQAIMSVFGKGGAMLVCVSPEGPHQCQMGRIRRSLPKRQCGNRHRRHEGEHRGAHYRRYDGKSCETSFTDSMHQGKDLPCDLVILDEAHFLGDKDRGVVWEEIMIYLPARINLLLLSATIGNGQEIADWLSSLRGKPCAVIKEERRPVPLFPLFLHPTGRLMPFLEQNRLFSRVGEFARSQGKYGRPPHFGEIIAVLKRYHLLPAIFFLKSRSECDAALKSCHPTSAVEDNIFGYELEEHLERFPYLKHHKQLHYLEHCLVAAHHGGQLPAWKFLVEIMMKRGHLQAIFATSTVAAGVNFPARTIVLFNSDLFNGREFAPLTGIEFHQMTGRAGRRGQDKIGLCFPFQAASWI